MIFNLYKTSTGELVGSMTCSASVADANISALQDGVGAYESSGVFDGEEYYYDMSNSIIPRPNMSASIDKTTILADGIDEAKITNIPTNSNVIIAETEYTVTDGEAVVSIPFPGEYSIVVECFPYKIKTFKLIAE